VISSFAFNLFIWKNGEKSNLLIVIVQNSKPFSHQTCTFSNQDSTIVSMNILLVGGSGTIGKHLIPEWLEAGHQIINLSRSAGGHSGGNNGQFQTQVWDGQKIPDLKFTPDWIINLAGAGIADESWTPARRKVLLESRVKTTRACVEYIRSHSQEVKLFVNASAVGFYGSNRTDRCTEDSAVGTDFLAEVCKAWEQEALRAPVRTVLLRIGVVLSKHGGALAKLLPVFRAGIGGWIGSGNQAFPWIDGREFFSVVNWLAENESISGPVNMCSPESITNLHFSKTLAKVLHRPCIFPVPAFALRLILGERASLLLDGQNMVPEKLIQNGYQFQYGELSRSLREQVGG